MINNIRVAVRLRPLLPLEEKSGQSSAWNVDGNKIMRSEEEYTFDHVFDMNSSNVQVYEVLVKEIVESALAGISGTVFAYGQTCSGKTYTMEGDLQRPGIMQLAFKHIFEKIKADKGNVTYSIKVSYLEMYKEKVFDLLSSSESELKVFKEGETFQTSAAEFTVTEHDELLKYLVAGSKKRTCAETQANERSSRSHSIFRLAIKSSSASGPPKMALLHMVDLAGSERVRQTGATGSVLKEGICINKSLLNLGLVIKHLDERRDFINYRDCKLTMLLKSSLGGNCLTCFICTCTPTAVEETVSTLAFGQRARNVTNRPTVNVCLDDTTALQPHLLKKIADLEEEIAELRKSRSHITFRRKRARSYSQDNADMGTSYSEAVPNSVPSLDSTYKYQPSAEGELLDELLGMVKKELNGLTTHLYATPPSPSLSPPPLPLPPPSCDAVTQTDSDADTAPESPEPKEDLKKQELTEQLQNMTVELHRVLTDSSLLNQDNSRLKLVIRDLHEQLRAAKLRPPTVDGSAQTAAPANPSAQVQTEAKVLADTSAQAAPPSASASTQTALSSVTADAANQTDQTVLKVEYCVRNFVETLRSCETSVLEAARSARKYEEAQKRLREANSNIDSLNSRLEMLQRAFDVTKADNAKMRTRIEDLAAELELAKSQQLEQGPSASRKRYKLSPVEQVSLDRKMKRIRTQDEHRGILFPEKDECESCKLLQKEIESLKSSLDQSQLAVKSCHSKCIRLQECLQQKQKEIDDKFGFKIF